MRQRWERKPNQRREKEAQDKTWDDQTRQDKVRLKTRQANIRHEARLEKRTPPHNMGQDKTRPCSCPPSPASSQGMSSMDPHQSQFLSSFPTQNQEASKTRQFKRQTRHGRACRIFYQWSRACWDTDAIAKFTLSLSSHPSFSPLPPILWDKSRQETNKTRQTRDKVVW